jgi:hypothetical protein
MGHRRCGFVLAHCGMTMCLVPEMARHGQTRSPGPSLMQGPRPRFCDVYVTLTGHMAALGSRVRASSMRSWARSRSSIWPDR